MQTTFFAPPPARPFNGAMLRQVLASGNLPIERVAARACLSVWQFERPDMSPKPLRRMVRFSYACKHKESARPDARA